MPEIMLHCETDGSGAWFEVSKDCRRVITLTELQLHLRQRKVIFGIDEAMLRTVSSGCRNGERVRVASCRPPEKGIPGRIEWLIDITKAGKPRELHDGRVNLRDLQFDTNVNKGDRLVHRIASVPGRQGVSIYGTPLDPPPVEDPVLLPGAGTAYESDNKEYVVAVRDGAVILNGHTIEVHNRKVIQSDIDYSTGNVAFNGDLYITGTVRSGFSVSAQGDIIISGGVEDAEIRSGGAMTIKGGATGSGSGNIVCGTTLQVHHVAQMKISAGTSVNIQEDAMHSTITAEGSISVKTIIGGTITAFSIAAASVGSDAGTRTIIDITHIAQLQRERYDLLKQFGIHAARRTELNLRMFALVRDGMDENGVLPPELLQTLDSFKENTVQCVETAGKIQQRIEKIDEIEKKQPSDSGIRIGVVYPNTVIRAGNEDRLIKDVQHNFFISSAVN